MANSGVKRRAMILALGVFSRGDALGGDFGVSPRGGKEKREKHLEKKEGRGAS